MSLRTGFVVQAASGGETLTTIAKFTGHGEVGRRHIKDLIDAGKQIRADHPGRALGL